MNLQMKLERLENAPAGRMGKRAVMELRYAYEVSRVEQWRWNSLIEKAAKVLESDWERQGAVTDGAAQEAEAVLMPMQQAAKQFTVLCVGHAHIDMNWMWRYDETVQVVLDTFRTVLTLMEEYPAFRFTQPQASVYEIVEKYDPSMLSEIRRRVAERRWELAATTWVEADRNMPCAESVARHHLYTRRYLKGLFPEAEDRDFLLDFEPDTFGHSENLPELLQRAGVKYYYHCRGDRDEPLRWWKSPSGAMLLGYREPFWYGSAVEAEYALAAPALCTRYGTDWHLRVYGVGDHGGGPTRRDIERILDMDRWPIFPRFRFGTCREFFERMESASGIPVVQGERNFIFSGCYTSQSRVTQANKYAEAAMTEAETMLSLAHWQSGLSYPNALMEEAWHDVLFNQFHDILPGSGTIDTREYAMGTFSRVLAAAGSQKSRAMRALGRMADTSAFLCEEDWRESCSEGAGAGFGPGNGMSGIDPTQGEGAGRPFRVGGVERGRGLNRIFHIFNPSAFERTGQAELTVFDWPGDYSRLRVCCGEEALPFQLLDPVPQSFWQHTFVRLLVQVTVPPCGRLTCVVSQDEDKELPTFSMPLDLRQEDPPIYELENEFLRIRLDPDTGAVSSLWDKERGCELSDGKTAYFRLIQEQPMDETAGTAWSVGRYRSVTELLTDVRIEKGETGPLRKSLKVTAYAENSKISYTLSLGRNVPWLELSCDVDWREVGVPGQRTPQLNFALPFSQAGTWFCQDVPGGVIDREGRALDVPALSFSAASYAEGRSLMLISDSHYGFRCESEPGRRGMYVDCLRSSTDPDPCPEFGRHQFRLGIALSDGSRMQLLRTAEEFCHPFSAVSDIPRKGNAPLKAMGIQASGCVLQAVKRAEDREALVLRLLEAQGTDSEARITLWREPVRVEEADTHEQPIPDSGICRVCGREIAVHLSACSVKTILVYFNDRK